MPKCARQEKLPSSPDLDEAGVRMRQVEAEHMQLHPYAADDANAFAEIDLRMARRMGQRHEDLARPAAGDPNVILHYGITAGKTVFEPQPFENPLRGVPLLRRSRLGPLTPPPTR